MSVIRQAHQPWKECKLGDVANYVTGKLNSNAAVPDGRYPFFTCSPETLRIDNYAFDMEALILAGNNADGVFSLKYYAGKFNAYQRTYLITIIDQKLTDYKYLFYSLKTQLSNLETISHGTATKYLTLPILNDIPILLPPLSEQRAIAGVLSSLDDKIDLLHRQNKTLEGMAEALWRKMFVPACAGESHADRENADPGWKKGKLGDLAEINPPRSIKKGTSATYIDMSNMPTNGPFPKDWIQREFTSGTKFKNGDTIIARITPCLENGKTAYVNFLSNDEIGWGSTEYIVLAPKKKFSPEWLYFLARNSDFRDFAIQNMTGTSGRQRVSGDSIAQYELLVPPISVSNNFKVTGQPIMEHIKQNSFQIRTLSRMRDTLLPKLMSGEVRVTL